VLGSLSDHGGEADVKEVAAKRKRFTVALAGNPNCGKTSLFNALTGAKAHVGNYPGVTVEKRSARVMSDDLDIEYVDLPGVYSLAAITLDESAARKFILHEEPDLVINIIDAGNLERNLLLTTQLMEMGVRMLLVLNMWDEAEKQGLLVNESELSRRLHSPIIKTVGHRGIGIKQLRATVSKMLLTSPESHFLSPVSYGAVVDQEIETISKSVAATPCNTLPPRWYAVNLLENSIILEEFADLALVEKASILTQVARSRKRIEQALDQKSEMAVGDGRHDYIRRTINAAIKPGSGDRMAFSNHLDNILTHRLFGYPIFLFFMWLIFQTTFVLGKYPADWIDKGVTALSGLVAAILPTGFAADLLTQGVIGGVGSVLVFMPNIMILFLGIAVLEDSGYMARAAFIMDRLMRALGLHGKAFIPMLMGFGCNVPAIMATRTLESQRDRILTILLIPFMSCSARLSVYVLFAGAFFAGNAGNVIFALYLLGVLVAVAVGWLLRKILFKDHDIPFIIEFPPYRRPTFRVGLSHMWERGKVYLHKMGGIILIASVVLWFLGAFPRVDQYSQDYDSQITVLHQSSDPSAAERIAHLQAAKASEDVAYSFVGRIGHAVEPLLQPLGFNWQMGVSLVTGFVAKEVVVSSMGVLYQIGEEVDETSTSLVKALRNPGGGITPLIAFAYLTFVLLYTPCISVLIAMRREIGTRWMAFGVTAQLVLAWGVAFVIYRLGLFLGLG
jgi:ferrous iron transport protein B